MRGSSGGSGFEKQRRCPSSALLLSYHQHTLSTRQTLQVATHVATCDFCAAEAQLLGNHLPVEDFPEPAPMPPQLEALAAALLLKDNSQIAELLRRTAEL
jgi:hypothetical protein